MLNLEFLLNNGYEINELTTLLELKNNQFESIDASFFERCLNLEILILDNNKLTKIEGNTFQRLKKLTELWLQNNKIKTIDAKFYF